MSRNAIGERPMTGAERKARGRQMERDELATLRRALVAAVDGETEDASFYERYAAVIERARKAQPR